MSEDLSPKGTSAQRSVLIIALTAPGKRLAERLSDLIPSAELWYKPQPFKDRVQTAYREGHPMIFVCATGIVVRVLGPILGSKLEDAPVCVLDEAGAFVIPLISGHEGGANQWAMRLSDALGAQAVITSAHSYTDAVYAVGMGCERHCSQEEIVGLFEQCLEQAGLTIADIDSLNSIDIKADEVGLIACAEGLDLDYQTWTKDVLSEVEPLLSTRSDYVFDTVGVYGVAESAALIGAREGVKKKDVIENENESKNGNASKSAEAEVLELALVKQKSERATCAIARAYVRQ